MHRHIKLSCGQSLQMFFQNKSCILNKKLMKLYDQGLEKLQKEQDIIHVLKSVRHLK